ncbi:STAS domain-containing protein [Streptomyces sp. NPDC096934]|uniref:STAS domain-containing protein n=1 Tax=Streptomyces sp. NPDC096934 TaxID=3155551 RepID=UPI003331CE16
MPEQDSIPAGLPVVVPCGDLDATTVQPMIEELESVRGRHGAVVLDASGISFANSSFLSTLLRCHQSTDLRIARPSPAVRRLLEITGAGAVLNIYPTVTEARKAAPTT